MMIFGQTKSLKTASEEDRVHMRLTLVHNPGFQNFTFSVGCAMSSTDPPVEVVLADGIYMLAVGAVEELLLGHIFSSVVLFHTIPLPKKHANRQTCCNSS